jgi:hypothetical protein
LCILEEDAVEERWQTVASGMHLTNNTTEQKGTGSQKLCVKLIFWQKSDKIINKILIYVQAWI